jgi:hypothetical protein
MTKPNLLDQVRAAVNTAGSGRPGSKIRVFFIQLPAFSYCLSAYSFLTSTIFLMLGPVTINDHFCRLLITDRSFREQREVG